MEQQHETPTEILARQIEAMYQIQEGCRKAGLLNEDGTLRTMIGKAQITADGVVVLGDSQSRKVWYLSGNRPDVIGPVETYSTVCLNVQGKNTWDLYTSEEVAEAARVDAGCSRLSER